MNTTVEDLRVKLKPILEKLVDPINQAQNALLDKIKEQAMSVIDPALEKFVKPHLSKILIFIKAPMVDAYEEAVKLFEAKLVDCTKDMKGKDDLKKSFSSLDWYPRSYELRPSLEKVEAMGDPLSGLREIFTDIQPWDLIYGAHDEIRKKSDNAVYTYEKKLLEEVEKDPSVVSDEEKRNVLLLSVRTSVVEGFRSDAQLATLIFYGTILKTIVSVPVEGLVFPGIEKILDPLSSQIPDEVKDYIDPIKIIENLLSGIIDDSIATVLNA